MIRRYILLCLFFFVNFNRLALGLQCACNVRPREVSLMLRDLGDQSENTPQVNAFKQIVSEIIGTAIKECERTGHCELNLKETTKKHIRPACMSMNKHGQKIMSCYFTEAASTANASAGCNNDGMYLCYHDHCNHMDDIEDPCSGAECNFNSAVWRIISLIVSAAIFTVIWK